MDFITAEKELELIQSTAVRLLWREAGHWERLAADYQSKYAFSSDYDKSYKHDYYGRAGACREVAGEVESVPLPNNMKEVAGFAGTLIERLKYFRGASASKTNSIPFSKRFRI